MTTYRYGPRIAAVLPLILWGCGDGAAERMNRRPLVESRTSADLEHDASQDEQDPDRDPGDGSKGRGGDKDRDQSSGDPEAGREYFTATIMPLFTGACQSCHADPRMPADIRAPLSIFSYEKMAALLGEGEGAKDNALIAKVRGVTTHGGGNRCQDGFEASPCKELVTWWEKEHGPDGGGGVLGAVLEVTALGRVYGWAALADDASVAVSVALYAAPPEAGDEPIGTLVANQAGRDGNTAGNHAFTFDVPVAMRDGQSHMIYAYAVVDGTEHALGSPTPMRAWTFSDEGRAYYDNNIRGQLNACQSCHTVSYEQQFYSLIAPSPAGGGTATNNQLINKPSQTNGTTHGGGQRCNGVNASPCREFQEWWRIEFGL